MRNFMSVEETKLENLIGIDEVENEVIDNFTELANTKFTGEELRKICKLGLSRDEVISLACWYNQKKEENWANSRIIKEFINYRENIEAIMALENWLFSQGICNNEHHFIMADLSRLSELLQTDEDYNLFKKICDDHNIGTKNALTLTSAFMELLKAKNQEVFPVPELERTLKSYMDYSEKFQQAVMNDIEGACDILSKMKSPYAVIDLGLDHNNIKIGGIDVTRTSIDVYLNLDEEDESEEVPVVGIPRENIKKVEKRTVDNIIFYTIYMKDHDTPAMIKFRPWTWEQKAWIDANS